MSVLFRLVGALIFIPKLFSQTPEACVAPSEPQKVRAFENVIYKKKLGMDIYLPQVVTSKPLPVAFIVHGGAWIQGDRKDFRPLAKQLTAMGYAGVTASYRLANGGGGKFPAPVEDLRCAIKTLKNTSGNYNLNTNKIVAIGFSAGGHLVAELALTADSDKFSDKECPVATDNTEVQGVVGYYGPYDLRSTKGLNFQQVSIITNFLGGLPELFPSWSTLASPVAQIGDESMPFYLVHAFDDDIVPVESSQQFSEALKLAEIPVKYVEVPEGGHGLDLFDDRPFTNEATCGSIDFLTNFAKN